MHDGDAPFTIHVAVLVLGKQIKEKSLLTYQFETFGISPRILAYQPGF